jgi:hypothetical protein
MVKQLVIFGICCGLIIALVACNRSSEDVFNLPEEEAGSDLRQTISKDPAEPLQFCDGSTAFGSDLQVNLVPKMPEPAARIPFRDPVFDACLVRVTDREKDLAVGDPSKGLKNEYARVQSFNADDTYILVRSTEANWYLYDAHTLRVLGRLPVDNEPRWDSSDPARLYYHSESRLMGLNVESGQQEIVHDYSLDFPGQNLYAAWTRYEGSPSIDSRYWGVIAQDESWLPVAFLVYDKQAGQVIARRDLRSWPAEDREIDSVTISPLGNYYLVYMDKYCVDKLGTESDPCGLMVYDRNLKDGRGLLPIIGHSDLALDVWGREVLIFQDIRQDEISLLDLETGLVTPLQTIDFSHSPIGFHFSGQAINRPGWAVVSTYSGAQPSATWMDDVVFAIELAPGGRVVRLAHTHSIVDDKQDHDYWAEPQASANRDLTRILFTSNWGRSGSEAVDMYMIVLPDDWFNQLP